jgi:hypothetical protein
MPKGIPGSRPSDPVPTAQERFWAKVDRGGPDECWPWTGAILRNGYGYFAVRHGRPILAHRWIYQQVVGPIPEGLKLDHQCHNADPACPGGSACLHRRCQNTAHLEPATTAENNRRGQGGAAVAARQQAKTHCPEGHPYSPENTYRDPEGHRHCRTCVRKQDRERKRRHRERKRQGRTM